MFHFWNICDITRSRVVTLIIDTSFESKFDFQFNHTESKVNFACYEAVKLICNKRNYSDYTRIDLFCVGYNFLPT